MTLVGRMGAARVLGVPACALYFKTTAFDLILPPHPGGQGDHQTRPGAHGVRRILSQLQVLHFPQDAPLASNHQADSI